MLAKTTAFVLRAPRAVLAGAVLLLVLAGLYGATAAQHLLSGGYSDPHSASARADEILADTFGRGGMQVVVKLDGPPGTNMVTDPQAQQVGNSIVAELATNPHVQQPILSVWDNPTLAPALVSGQCLSQTRPQTQKLQYCSRAGRKNRD